MKLEVLNALKLNVKVLNTMRKIHEDLENFHRRKVMCIEILKTKIKKQLELSLEAQSVLVPSGLQVNKILHVPKPLQCCIYAQSNTHDLYVAHFGAGPENGICSWSKPFTEEQIKRTRKSLNCRITNMVLVTSNYIYVASCDDLVLRTFNNNFREQSSLQLQYSILSMIYDEKRNVVISGSVGAIQQWKLASCIHNAPILLKETKLEDKIYGITPWISFLHLNKEQDQLIALTGTALFFVDLNTFEQVAFVENRHRFPLTVCLSYVPRQYLVTGAKDGDIKVWNMSMASFPYVGCFTGHLKRIISILTHPNEPLLITSSADSTIRFWRIETFQETYRFDVLDTICAMYLVGPRKLYYTSPKYVCLLDFNYFHSIFTLVGAKCTAIERIAPSVDKPSRIMLVGDDGGVRIVSPTHGNILTMLFPIVTHKALEYTHDPLEHRIYILLQDGGVMVVSSKTNPCLTLQLLKAKRPDEEVVCLGLVFLDFDNKRKSLLFGAHADGCISLLKGRDISMKTASPSRGVILRFETNSVDNSFADFLTYNTENSITLWKVVQIGKGVIHLHMIDDIQLHGPPSHITFRENCIGLSNGNRFSTMEILYKKRANCSVRMHEHAKDETHKEAITQLQNCSQLPLFATASLDGQIKIWSTKCQLIRELVFDRTLSGLCFANARGDLLVGFQANLHFVSLTEYLPYKYLKKLLKEDELSDDRTEYCISFDPLLKFWYDPERVPSVRMNDSNKVNEDDASSNNASNGFYDLYSFNNDQLNATKNSSQDSCRLKKQILTPDKLRECRRNSLIPSSSPINLRRSSLAQRNDTAESNNRSLSKALTDEIMSILSGEQIQLDCHSVCEGDQNNAAEHSKVSTPYTEKAISLVKKYWPCAPDGFVPNSIIRDLINPKQSELDKVEPWKPRKFSNDVEAEDLYSNYDDDFEENVRTWYSDDEEDTDEFLDMDDDFSFTSRRRKISLGSSKSSPKSSKKSSSDDNKKPKPVTKKNVVRKNLQQSVKKIRFKQKEKSQEIAAVEEDEEEESIPPPRTVKESNKNIIPQPFAPYFNKPWFPRDSGFDLKDIIMRLISTLDGEQPFAMKEIYKLISDTHKLHTLPEDCMKLLIDRLLHFLDHESGQVRHYTVKMLLDLGQNKKEVILKLVRKLDDPVLAVREEVKLVLERIAGIGDSDTLVAALMELGELRDVEVANDVEVVESFRETLVTKRDSFMQKVINRSTDDSSTQHNVFGWISKFRNGMNQAKKKKNTDQEIDLGSSDAEKGEKHDSDKIEQEKLLKEKIINDWATLLNKKKPDVRPQVKQRTKLHEDLVPTNIPSPKKDFVQTFRNSSSMFSLDTSVTTYNESEADLTKYTTNHLTTNVQHDSTPSKNCFNPGRFRPISQQERTKEYGSSMLELQLNKLILHKGEVREDVIRSVAPRVLDKFKELGPESDIIRSLCVAKRKKEDMEEENLKEDGSRQALLVQNFQLKLMEIANNIMHADYDGDNENPQNEIETANKSKSSNNINAIFLQRAILATAISALRSKRQNEKSLPQHGLLGNQALNDINQLMQMFQNSPTKTFDEKSLNTVSDLVQEIQEELGVNQFSVKNKKLSTVKQTSTLPVVESYNKNGKLRILNEVKTLPLSTKTTTLRFIPSPFSHDSVPGVCGERILSSLRILPSIPRQPRNESWFMKSIPERNGNLTVVNNCGHTNYGSMAFHWTTWTTDYDMNQNTRNLRTVNTKKDHLPTVTEVQYNHSTSKKPIHCALTPPKLKSLTDFGRGSGVDSANFYRNIPAPPNTALAFTK